MPEVEQRWSSAGCRSEHRFKTGLRALAVELGIAIPATLLAQADEVIE